jgi:tetratricopeptide repeat protein 8
LPQSVLTEDATNVEAIACIGMNHFYSDQPELSLR